MSGQRPVRKPVPYATRQWGKERDKFRCVDCNTHENLTVGPGVQRKGQGH